MRGGTISVAYSTTTDVLTDLMSMSKLISRNGTRGSGLTGENISSHSSPSAIALQIAHHTQAEDWTRLRLSPRPDHHCSGHRSSNPDHR